MRYLIGLIAALVLIGLGFFGGVRYKESKVVVRYDTTFVELPQRTVHLPIPEPKEAVLPDQEILVDTLWRESIQLVLNECAEDSIKIRTYETDVSDSLLEGTLYSSVFGILLDQKLEYQLIVPHIKETVLQTPVRGLIGGEINAVYPFSAPSASLIGGLRLPKHEVLLRGDPFRREIGLIYLKTF